VLPEWRSTAAMLHLFHFCECEWCVLYYWPAPDHTHTPQITHSINCATTT